MRTRMPTSMGILRTCHEPGAAQALKYIQRLYGIELQSKGLPPAKRLDIRAAKSHLVVDVLHHWMLGATNRRAGGSATA